MRTHKLYLNIGITDIITKECGKTLKSYTTWTNMLRRCYSIKSYIKNPTYIGCTVCDEWKLYSNFKKWFDENYIENYELDKDILIDGNKIYSPDTCCFIPKYINTLFIDCAKSRGIYPLGVYYKHKISKYCCQINMYGANKHIGTFDAINDAVNAYKRKKLQYCMEIALKYMNSNMIDSLIYNSILTKANKLYG